MKRARWIFAAIGGLVVGAAMWRGGYLLGVAGAVVYGCVTTAWCGLLARSFVRQGAARWIQAIAVLVVAPPLALALAFPAAINSDVQPFLDRQAVDRAVRAELNQAFVADEAYARLSVSTRHLKVVNVTIAGRFSARGDLERLRRRIASECPTLALCPLHWAVELADSGERVEGLDRDLFGAAEQAE